jgi:protease I
MKRIAILIEDQYEVLEAWYPYLRLREENMEPLFVGTGKDGYGSKEGYPAQEDLDIIEAEADTFDGVIVPGGYAPDLMRRKPEMVRFLKEVFESGKMAALICHGIWMAVSAGILEGRQATCHFAVKDDVVNAGAAFLDKEVVVDGNLITSRNQFDLPYFSKSIIKTLEALPAAAEHQTT